MNMHESFSNEVYEQQRHLAEVELSSFIATVTKSYGPEQATISAGEWLEESDLIDSPPRSEPRDWRAVTIAASARLATRVDTKAALAEADAQGAKRKRAANPRRGVRELKRGTRTEIDRSL